MECFQLWSLNGSDNWITRWNIKANQSICSCCCAQRWILCWEWTSPEHCNNVTCLFTCKSTEDLRTSSLRSNIILCIYEPLLLFSKCSRFSCRRGLDVNSKESYTIPRNIYIYFWIYQCENKIEKLFSRYLLNKLYWTVNSFVIWLTL